jgi:AcrR family transcriptional regulator
MPCQKLQNDIRQLVPQVHKLHTGAVTTTTTPSVEPSGADSGASSAPSAPSTPSGTVASGGLRERKKTMTSAALQQAALDLFERQGFDGTTVEEIAAACDVSPRTFFRYFATKEDVLFGDSAAKLARILEALEARPAGEEPAQSVREAIRAVACDYTKDRDYLAQRARIMAATPSLQMRSAERQRGWEENVLRAMNESPVVGRGSTALEMRLAVGTATAAFRAAVDTWLAEPPGRDLETVVDEAFSWLTSSSGANARPHPSASA